MMMNPTSRSPPLATHRPAWAGVSLPQDRSHQDWRPTGDQNGDQVTGETAVPGQPAADLQVGSGRRPAGHPGGRPGCLRRRRATLGPTVVTGWRQPECSRSRSEPDLLQASQPERCRRWWYRPWAAPRPKTCHPLNRGPRAVLGQTTFHNSWRDSGSGALSRCEHPQVWPVGLWRTGGSIARQCPGVAANSAAHGYYTSPTT
jgi:hypothetical protein